MPFNVPAETLKGTRLALPIEVGEVPSPGLIERFSAAFQTENATIDFITRPRRPPAEREFNPLDHLLPGEEPIADEYAGARSMAELNQMRNGRQRRDQLRRQIGTGPAGLLASLTAGIIDPIPMLAGGGVFSAARGVATVGRIAQGVRGATAAAVDIGTQEALLAQGQPERDPSRIVAGMLLGAVGGGVLGAVLGKAAAEDLATMGTVAARGRDARGRFVKAPSGVAVTLPARDNLGRFMKIPDEPAVAAPGAAEAIGAAPIVRLRAEDLEIAPAFGLEKLLGKFGSLLSIPSVRIMNGRLVEAKRTLAKLTDLAFFTKGMMRGTGVGQSADVAARSRLFAAETDMIKGMKAAFREHRQKGGKGTEAEFQAAVGKAMRRGDAAADAVVTATAKSLRQLVTRIEREAGELLPEHFKVAGLPRDFSVNELLSRSNEFIRRLANTFEDSGMDPTDAEDLARALLAKLTHESQIGRLTAVDEIEGGREALAAISDDLIEDFLEDNAQMVLGRWMRTVITDTELARVFGNADPQKGFDDAIAKVKDEAFEARKGMTERAEVARSEAEEADMIGLLSAIFNRVRGTDAPNRNPALDVNFGMRGLRRAGRITRNITSTQLMGSVALSNLGDAGTAIIKEGFTKLIGTQVAELGRGLKGIKLTKKQNAIFGIATEMAMHARRSAITGASEMRIEELGRAATLGEKVEAKVQRGTDLYFKATLLAPLIDYLKTASSMVISTRILEAAEKVAAGRAIGQHERAALAAAGLDDAMLRRFAAQAEHWERTGDGPFKVLTAGADAWTDIEAKRAFGNALLRETDTAVVTPFAGDLPLLFDKEWGRVIAQFKRFSFASTSRLTLATAQRIRAGDVQVLGNVATAIGIGAGITALKDLAAQGELRERTQGEWVADAVDRAGVVSMFFEMNAIMDVFPGKGPLTAVLGQTSRFEARTPFERLLGPAAGQIESASIAGGRALDNIGAGPFTESELRSLKYLTPGQNLIGVGLVMNEAVDGLAQMLGLPEREPRR